MNKNIASPNQELYGHRAVGAGIFSSRPPEAVVKAFRKHVEETGDPHSFLGVVDTKPPDKAEFVWLTEKIQVPISKRIDGNMIPCPWCSPTKPKFATGRLLWFEQEAVIRFVGWACSQRHLDSDAMRAADDQWREERRRAHCNAFLRANCRHVADFMAFVNTIESTAKACDNFHNGFAKDDSDALDKLNRYARGGRLMVDQELGRGARRDGQSSISVLFGVLQGAAAITKTNPHLAKKLRTASAQLASIEAEAHVAREGELLHLSIDQRRVLQEIIQKAHAEIVNAANRIRDFQAFLSPRNIELLNAWCCHQRADIFSDREGIDIQLDGLKLRIGYRVNGNRCTSCVNLDGNLFRELPSLPALDKGIYSS